MLYKTPVGNAYLLAEILIFILIITYRWIAEN